MVCSTPAVPPHTLGILRRRAGGRTTRSGTLRFPERYCTLVPYPGQPVAQDDHQKVLRAQRQNFRIAPVTWVKGHAGIPGNKGYGSFSSSCGVSPIIPTRPRDAALKNWSIDLHPPEEELRRPGAQLSRARRCPDPNRPLEVSSVPPTDSMTDRRWFCTTQRMSPPIHYNGDRLTTARQEALEGRQPRWEARLLHFLESSGVNPPCFSPPFHLS